MGLSVSVGLLTDLIENDEEGAEWLRQDIAKMNRVLQSNRLPAHVEPELVAPFAPKGTNSFPYSFLQHLRRAYVCMRTRAPLRRGEVSTADEKFIDGFVTKTMDSHLMLHSDCEGFYVPIDFKVPICDDDVLGGYLGSSQRLKSELQQVAPILGIRLENGTLPDSERSRLADIDDATDPEPIVWLALWQAAEHSLKHGSLVAFT